MKKKLLSQKSNGKYLGESALFLMTIIWGGSFVVVKESLNNISTLPFLSFRYGIASIVLALILIIARKKYDISSILPGIFLGVILFLGSFTQTLGLKYTTATKSGFITGASVVMIPIFQLIIEKKKPSKGSIVGIVLVFLGIIFLSSGGKSLTSMFSELGKYFNYGDGLTLACSFIFAIHIVYIDVISTKNDYWTILLSQLITVCVLSTLGSLLFVGISVETTHISFSKNLWFGLLFTSLLATLFTLGLQTKFQKIVSPSKAGIIYSFEPIFAALFAFSLLNEKINNFGLVGCALIILGLCVSEILDSFLEKKNGNATV